MQQAFGRRIATLALTAAMACAGGCFAHKQIIVPPPDGTVPRELGLMTLPPYMVEPPDVLAIDVVLPPKEAEKQPYVTSLPPQPISGQFLVRPDGSIGLGIYGTIMVSGLTLDQARERVREFVAKVKGEKPELFVVTVDVVGFNSKKYSGTIQRVDIGNDAVVERFAAYTRVAISDCGVPLTLKAIERSQERATLPPAPVPASPGDRM